MSDFVIKDMQREFASKFIGASEPLITARLVTENGDWLGVSQYHDETIWAIDCYFKANGFPVFASGTGARIGGKALAPDHPVVAELESMKASLTV